MASVSVGRIRLLTRWVSDVARAIDFLITLTSLKQRMVQIAESVPAASDALERGLREAVGEQVAGGLDLAGEMGLRIVFRVPTKGWIGTELQTPAFKLPDLDRALEVSRRLRDARGHISHGLAWMFNFSSLEELDLT